MINLVARHGMDCLILAALQLEVDLLGGDGECNACRKGAYYGEILYHLQNFP